MNEENPAENLYQRAGFRRYGETRNILVNRENMVRQETHSLVER